MSYRNRFLPLCLVLTLAACQRTEKTDIPASTEQSTFPALNKANLAGYENYSMLTIAEDWKVMTWSSRMDKQKSAGQKGDALTTVSILKKDKAVWREVSELQFSDSYNPRLHLHTEFSYAGKPLFIVAMQQGAVVEQMNVYGMVQGEYKLLQTLLGAAFEWNYDAASNQKQLIAIAHDNSEKPALYQWNGQQFMLLDIKEVAVKDNGYKID